jgi:hypothetical protein
MLYILVQMFLTPLLSIAMIIRMLLTDIHQLLAQDSISTVVMKIERYAQSDNQQLLTHDSIFKLVI